MTPRRNERGAVAIVVAFSTLAILVVAAMVVDFGLVRVDRQVDKSAADAAAIAGLQGLNGGDAEPRPFVGVCTALRYLAANNDRFSGMTSASGVWTDGNGVAAIDGCTDSSASSLLCVSSAVTPSSWARFTWSGTYDSQPLTVVIQSGYELTTSSGFSEDSLTTAAADNDDGGNGCNQLSVTVTQSRDPGLGSLATSSDLTTTVRSVGRVARDTGGYAPAMLLLRRTGCPALEIGSGGSGSGSYVHVEGRVSTNGLSQPGTIHADTDGSDCSGSSGSWVFYGKSAVSNVSGGGIMALAAPTVADTSVADPTKPGSITSVAGTMGVALDTIRDATANVCSSTALTTCTGTSTEPTGLGQVTRSPVDARYRSGGGGGVASMVSSAQSSVFGVSMPNNAAQALALGFNKYGTCGGPGEVTIDGVAPVESDRVWIRCNRARSFAGGAVNAGTVVFSGTVEPDSAMSLPNASEVYIFGDSSDALSVGGGSAGFAMNTTGNLSGSTCTPAEGTGRQAKLMVKDGGLRISTGGTLRLCNTTVVLMGGENDGCLPDSDGTEPTVTACGGAIGTGRITQSGGSVDWTAPNQRDVMTLSNGDPDPDYAPLWTDPAGPEDLALWTETGATTSSTTSTMGGNGLFAVQGVFMVPNYGPLTLTGGGLMDLTNAQFIATRIELNGGTRVQMSVDPNSAVTLPKLLMVGLVR